METQLDILFINIGGTKKKVYQELSKDFSACEPPFWAALTAGYVRKHGFSVEILDANGLNLDYDETVAVIAEKKPRCVGIVVYSQQANCSTPIMIGVETLSRKIKQELPEQTLMISGWHPSTLPERTLLDTQADFVVQGEGFRVIKELLAGAVVEDIPGLWRMADGKPVPPKNLMPNIENLSEELDEVAWDLLPWEKAAYRAFNWMCLGDFSERHHSASMFTSLGCPFRCDFCAIHATYGERKIRYWSADWVLKQFDTLALQYGVRHIDLKDELFVFNPKHYLPIAERLIERPYKLNICAFARVDAVDRMGADDLAKLKKAGFNWFKMGIETPCKKNLDAASKGHYGKDDIRRAVQKVHDAGIDLCANFMFGFEEDDYESMQENFNFAMELNCAFPSFFCVMAIPGSELYDKVKQRGGELPAGWLGYASQAYEFFPMRTKFLSPAQVLEFRDYVFEAYFSNPRYLNMIERKFGKEARIHIHSMNKIKLKRALLEENQNN